VSVPIVICSVRKHVGSLEYLVLEHSRVGPAQILERLLVDAAFGVVLLGTDGPHLISPAEAQDIATRLRAQGILADIRDSLPWISSTEFPKLLRKNWTCEGDAALFTREPGLSVRPKAILGLMGFNKDRLPAASIALLEGILPADGIYIQDDFQETLLVTKNEDRVTQILTIIDSDFRR
jgi:hypothetical protein